MNTKSSGKESPLMRRLTGTPQEVVEVDEALLQAVEIDHQANGKPFGDVSVKPLVFGLRNKPRVTSGYMQSI